MADPLPQWMDKGSSAFVAAAAAYLENGILNGHQNISLTSFGSNKMSDSQILDDIGFDADESQLDASGVEAFGAFDDVVFDVKPGVSSSRQPRSVHQCSVCDKKFVSYKGLQQHAIIHTDQKPFTCDICNKSFRFKSNLFEHRSVHSGFTPHTCPYCGKTCRLKGNLKKHLKTHVSTKEELDQAWKPFASNRRPPAEVPNDAIIIRSGSESLFNPPQRVRKRKLGIGPDPSNWLDKVKKGEILQPASMSEKMRCLSALLESAEQTAPTLDEFFAQARVMAFERYDCPLCKSVFLSRAECLEHLKGAHPSYRDQRPLFCDVCIKSFVDRTALEQHESYHESINDLLRNNEIALRDPEFLLPQCADEEGADSVVSTLLGEEREMKLGIPKLEVTNGTA